MKKFITSMLTLALMMPVMAPIASVNAADGEVCGTDGITYDSSGAAETAEVEVSYDFACISPTDEDDLYEETADISFAGMLIEIGSTDLPTTIIVRDNKDGHDYTIEVDTDTILGVRKGVEVELSDWIPGDQIKVKGAKNDNTENIEADSIVNLSFSLRVNQGVNGWITKIDTDTKEITYQWANAEHTFTYTDDTKFVVGGINPASVGDLAVNDRIRGRLDESEAKIIVVLRRGEDLFMKIRTFRPNAELVSMNTTVVPTTIEVKILATPGLKAGDVNNLIGGEGTIVTINVTEDTKMVRKYFGKTNLEDYSVGDNLKIVGRVNDDGTVDAKLLKNNSIWQTTLRAHAGVVTEVNTDENFLTVNWTPVKHSTKMQLKATLNGEGATVEAQMVGAADARLRAVPTLYTVQQKQSLRERIQNKVENFKEELVGKIKRQLRVKNVKIDRIKHENVKMKDLIERMPAKRMKVEISADTKIVIGNNQEGTIADIKNGDKVRVRGTRHATLDLISAETIVVVSALPEIEEDLEITIDEVNGTVEVIVTDDEEDTEGDNEEEDEDSDTDDEDGEDTATTTADSVE